MRKQWAAFGGIWKDSMGKIMRDNGSSLEILYIEGQYYPWEFWDSKYVKRFNTPEELVRFIITVGGDCPLDYDLAMKRLKEDFPSDFKRRSNDNKRKNSKSH